MRQSWTLFTDNPCPILTPFSIADPVGAEGRQRTNDATSDPRAEQLMVVLDELHIIDAFDSR